MKTTAYYVERGKKYPGDFKMSPPPEEPCSEHPNWGALECVWCRREGTGAYRRNAGYRLSVEEKKKLEAQLGRPVDDYAELKRIYREQNLRDLEKGEPAAEKKDLIREWARSGFSGPNPVGHSSLSMPKRKRETFEEWRRRRIDQGDRRVR